MFKATAEVTLVGRSFYPGDEVPEDIVTTRMLDVGIVVKVPCEKVKQTQEEKPTKAKKQTKVEEPVKEETAEEQEELLIEDSAEVEVQTEG